MHSSLATKASRPGNSLTWAGPIRPAAATHRQGHAKRPAVNTQMMRSDGAKTCRGSTATRTYYGTAMPVLRA